MTMIPDNSGKIKIVLTSEDMKELGVSLQTLDCSDPDTRLLLRAVFQLAAYRLGKNFRSKRLLIEAYPHINGGGVLYFTPLEEKNKLTTLRIKHSSADDSCFNYIFPDGDGLLRAIDTLYKSPDTKELISVVYNIDNIFLLSVYGDSSLSALYEIKEFSQHFFRGEQLKKYTREHGKALTGQHAILEIGKKISQDSLKS